MEIRKTASGKSLVMSKAEWVKIGHQQGWLQQRAATDYAALAQEQMESTPQRIQSLQEEFPGPAMDPTAMSLSGRVRGLELMVKELNHKARWPLATAIRALARGEADSETTLDALRGIASELSAFIEAAENVAAFR